MYVKMISKYVVVFFRCLFELIEEYDNDIIDDKKVRFTRDI